MKRLALLSLILSMAIGASSQEKSEHAIAGTVIDHASRKPLRGVNVSVQKLRRSTKTDSEGRFVLSGLPAGTHELRFRLDDYIPMNFRDVPETSRLQKALVITMSKTPVTQDRIGIYRPDSTIDFKARIYDPTKKANPDSLDLK